MATYPPGKREASNKSGRYSGHADRGSLQLDAAVGDMKKAGIDIGDTKHVDLNAPR
ncbi:MAG: hypothetical protein FJ096_16010 [Deltaproteobacteria bacterium]|nr:hypothetical protein [Deltaproteobacteria bacterium]